MPGFLLVLIGLRRRRRSFVVMGAVLLGLAVKRVDRPREPAPESEGAPAAPEPREPEPPAEPAPTAESPKVAKPPKPSTRATPPAPRTESEQPTEAEPDQPKTA